MKKRVSIALALQLCLLQGVCSANTAVEKDEITKETEAAVSAVSAVSKSYSSWGPVTATFGPGGIGFPVGKFAVVLNYRFIEADGMYLGDDKISDAVELTKNIGVVKFRYGIAPGLDIRTATAFYDVNVEKLATGTDATKDGVGDTTALFHKIVMNQKKGDPFSLAFDLGGTFPTATVDSNTIDTIGNRAWGAMTGVAATYMQNGHRFDQEFNYAAFTEGEHDYTKPQRFRCNTTYAYALSSMFDLGLESSFEWNDEEEQYGEDLDNSKWEWYVGPKVAIKMKKYGLFAGLGLMFPVDYEYDSVTTSDEYRVEFKIAKVF